MDTHDIIVKQTKPVRVAEATGTAPGLGTDKMSPVFTRLLPQVLAHLQTAGARPGISIAHYETAEDDGSFTLHVGFDIGTQEVVGTDQVRVVELPVVEVASVIHRGTMEGIAGAFDALLRWTKTSSYSPAGPSRELYLEWHDEDPTLHVTELQLLIAR